MLFEEFVGCVKDRGLTGDGTGGMKSVPKISVVVPAYNAGEFLEECLDSIMGQTFRDFEVIVIDDGSTDSTASIAASFAARDPRFRVISTDNGGVSRARNIGIREAAGSCISFADADDVMAPKALERMWEVMFEHAADVCVSAFQNFSDRDSLCKFLKEEHEFTQTEIYVYQEAMKLALYQQKMMNSPWGILVRRSLLGEDKRYRESIRYEDLDAFYRFYEGAARIAYINEPLYYYRRNPNSFINTWSEARLDVLDVTDRIMEFMEERYPELVPAAQDRRFSAHYNMLVLMKKNGVKNPAALERCRRVIKEGRLRALKDPEVRLKNKLGALLSYLFV